jgi:hypothetical protein
MEIEQKDQQTPLIAPEEPSMKPTKPTVVHWQTKFYIVFSLVSGTFFGV